MQWFSVDLHLHHKPIIFPSTKEQQGWQPAQPHSDGGREHWLRCRGRDGSHIAAISATLGSGQCSSSLTFKSAKRFSLLSVGSKQMQCEYVCFC